MGSVTNRYLRVNGDVVEKTYIRLPYSERNKRPKCPLNDCGSKLVRLYSQERGVPNSYGFRCNVCNSVFITNCDSVFKVELEYVRMGGGIINDSV